MSRSYELDPKAAAESGTSKRITESGVYRGHFKTAWGDKNAKGTESVNLVFVSNDGQECGPIALYTYNYKGDALPSFGTLNAIMACLRLRSLKPVPGKVVIYSYLLGEEETLQKDVYLELTDKPIGILIQMEEYTASDGSTKKKPNIFGAFEDATNLVAKEILDKVTEPKLLDGMKRSLLANPIKAERKQSRPSGTPPISGSDTAFNDDIPF